MLHVCLAGSLQLAKMCCREASCSAPSVTKPSQYANHSWLILLPILVTYFSGFPLLSCLLPFSLHLLTCSLSLTVFPSLPLPSFPIFSFFPSLLCFSSPTASFPFLLLLFLSQLHWPSLRADSSSPLHVHINCQLHNIAVEGNPQHNRWLPCLSADWQWHLAPFPIWSAS